LNVLNSLSAPNNQAFADLDPKPNSMEELTSVLTYHVIAGEKLPRQDLVAKVPSSIETVNGASVDIDLKFGVGGGSSLMINKAEVIEADIDACNGVIHIIDKVLLPPEPEPPQPSCSPSILDVAVGRPDLSELVKALTEAELDDVLKGEGPFTVFGTCSDVMYFKYLEIIYLRF